MIHIKGAQFRAMEMLGLDLPKSERQRIRVHYIEAPEGTSAIERVEVVDGVIHFYSSEVDEWHERRH